MRYKFLSNRDLSENYDNIMADNIYLLGNYTIKCFISAFIEDLRSTTHSNSSIKLFIFLLFCDNQFFHPILIMIL
jgi:hypothetical protein